VKEIENKCIVVIIFWLLKINWKIWMEYK